MTLEDFFIAFYEKRENAFCLLNSKTKNALEPCNIA